MATPGLAEKLDKIRMPKLESQKQTAIVLQAVDETLKQQHSDATPTAYFAALLSLLASNSADQRHLTTSIIYLLDVVTPYAPQPLLRARFTQILQILAPVISQAEADAPLLRPSIGCLEALLLAQDSSAWALSGIQLGPRSAVAALLKLTLDPRPKVRKRAQDALRNVLKNPPPSPALDHPAADMCAEAAMTALGELASAGETKRKQKTNTEIRHDPNMIHALQSVKTVASASGGWPSKKIEPLCELLLGVARSGNEHMTVVIFEIFEMIFEGMADELASAKLPRLLEIVSELRPASNDTQLLPPWVAILSRGYDVAAQLEPEDTFQKLPEVFQMIADFLESPAENIRTSAAECLVSFLANCIPNQVIIEPSVYDEKTIDKIVKIAETLLTVRYQAAWPETFSVIGAMLDRLRWRSAPALLEVVKNIGEIRGNDSFANKKPADEVLGSAVRAMGPEAVLHVLPLNLLKPTKDQPGRAWMLPLLRDYTANTNLRHFRTDLVPLSEAMFQRVMDHGNAPKTMETKVYETIVEQIWSMLPGFCDLPLDLQAAFDQSFAEMLANLLYQQVNLRSDICRALKSLIESNQAIATIAEGEDDMLLLSRVSIADAQKNLEYMGGFAGNFLAVLFNVYGQTMPQSRGLVLQTINAFLSITPPAELKETFDRVCKLFATSVQSVGESKEKGEGKMSDKKLPSTIHTLMDLIITMSIYLPRECFVHLFEISSLAVMKDNDTQLQKKAYKLIPRLAESDIGRLALQERQAELQSLLLAGTDKVTAPARRERLAAIGAMVPFLSDKSLHFIPATLSEVVISCKENNERARSGAFELLVLMAEKMDSSKGASIDNSKVPHMPADAAPATASREEFFTMVSAGLAGSTPHMISASITAITRLLYEYHRELAADMLGDLLQTMDLFLTSNNREIVKSVLGFIKVCVIGLSTELVTPRLETLVPNLMVWSHEHKGHFRAKVKHILERLLRRFGYDLINKHCPEADRKLINNIRKTKERNKRKKDAAKEEGEGDDATDKAARPFESEFDRALYSSSDSEASDEEEAATQAPAGKQGKNKRQKGNQYIVEGDDEPLDLLDKNALANISSTKPVRLRKQVKTKAKTDLDGKLILGRDDSDDDTMVINTTAQDGPTGVEAYALALKSGKDVPRKGQRGKLKWSNKRGGDNNEEEEGMDIDEQDVSALKASLSDSNKSPLQNKRKGGHARSGSRSGKPSISAGRRGLGEEKRRGQPVHAGVSKGKGRK